MTLEQRLAAVERTLTRDEHAPADLSAPAALETRVESVESQLDDIETRLADVEGSVAGIRGHVGHVESVDQRTEQAAQRALATAREAKRRVDEEAPAPREQRVVIRESEPEPDTGDGLVAGLRSLW